MTRRAARMLAALEDGCRTRQQIFAHQGRFSLLNNGAAELRECGIDVVWEFVDGDYVYHLGEGVPSPGTAVSPAAVALALAETPSGQISFEVGA